MTMVPRAGELLDLNMSARYDGPGTNGEVPTISLGNLSVSVYVVEPGVFRVSLDVFNTPDPRIMTHENDEDAPLVEFAVNGNVIRTY